MEVAAHSKEVPLRFEARRNHQRGGERTELVNANFQQPGHPDGIAVADLNSPLQQLLHDAPPRPQPV